MSESWKAVGFRRHQSFGAVRSQQACEDTAANLVPQLRLAGELAIDVGPHRERRRRRALPRQAGEAAEWSEAPRRFRAEALVDLCTQAVGLVEAAARDGGVQLAEEDHAICEQIELPVIRGRAWCLARGLGGREVRRVVLPTWPRDAREEWELANRRRSWVLVRGHGQRPLPGQWAPSGRRHGDDLMLPARPRPAPGTHCPDVGSR